VDETFSAPERERKKKPMTAGQGKKEIPYKKSTMGGKRPQCSVQKETALWAGGEKSSKTLTHNVWE